VGGEGAATEEEDAPKPAAGGGRKGATDLEGERRAAGHAAVGDDDDEGGGGWGEVEGDGEEESVSLARWLAPNQLKGLTLSDQEMIACALREGLPLLSLLPVCAVVPATLANATSQVRQTMGGREEDGMVERGRCIEEGTWGVEVAGRAMKVEEKPADGTLTKTTGGVS